MMNPTGNHMDFTGKGENGISLVELSIFLVVVGLVVAGLLYGIQAKLAKERLQKTNDAIFTITDAMEKYFSKNGRYPCPSAIRNVGPNTPEYGKETNCALTTISPGNCNSNPNDPYCIAIRGSDRIRIGGVPFKELKIGKEDVLDGYYNRFTYAVTERQAVQSTYSIGAGRIDLRDYDAGGALTSRDVDFVLVSHGPDGAGSYTAGGVAHGQTCSGSARDRENCDNDFTFEKRPFSTAGGSSYFDDSLIYKLSDWLYIWDETVADNESIYNRNIGKMGVGIQDPAEKLHVAAGNVRVENGRMMSGEVCDRNTGKCFFPSLLGGNSLGTAPADPTPTCLGAGYSASGGGYVITGYDSGGRPVCSRDMVCSPGSMLVGFAGGQPICLLMFGSSNGGCTGYSFLSGINVNMTTGSGTGRCTNAYTGSSANVPMN